MRELQTTRNESYAPRKSYGNPSSNSLMDESHNLSTDKDTSSSRVEDRSSDRRQYSYSHPTPGVDSVSASGGRISSNVYLSSFLSTVLTSVLWRYFQ